jgi:hypothetical protein
VSDGTNVSIDTVTVHVNADDDAPSVDAGPDQSVDENAPVTLAATGSDPENLGLTYTWTQTGGPAVAITDSSSSTATFTAPERLANTTLTFQVAVSDGTTTTYDTVTVLVNADNDAPSVDAGPPQTVHEMAPVQLSATANDAEGQGMTYAWTQVSGPSVTLANANGASPSFTAPMRLTDVTLRFQVAVSDGVNTTYDTVDVLVAAVNQTPESIEIEGSVIGADAVDGTHIGTVRATDGDVGDVLRYEITDGAPRFAIDPSTGELTVGEADLLDRYATTEYVITVRVTDLSGAFVERTIRLEMMPTAPPPPEPGIDTTPSKDASDESTDQPSTPSDSSGPADPVVVVAPIPNAAATAAPAGSGAFGELRDVELDAVQSAVAPVGWTDRDPTTEWVLEAPLPVEVTASEAVEEEVVGVEAVIPPGETFDGAFEQVVESTAREVAALQESIDQLAVSADAQQGAVEETTLWALLWGAVRGIQGSEREPTPRQPEDERLRGRSQK